MTKNEAYRALSDLITKGFLFLRADLAGLPMVFKTVNESEFDLIKMCAGSESQPDYNIKFNVYFMAFSVFIFDGENCLPERHKKIKELYDFFSNIPLALHTKIIQELETLKGSMVEASLYLEGFCYLVHSRSMWQKISSSPNREEFTGIKGTEALGLNAYQGIWLHVNRTLDSEEEYSKNFSLAVLTASATNPKGAKNVRAKHDAAMLALQDKRKKLAREGTTKRTEWSPEGWAAPVDTAEELVAELNRQMRGEKDKHDLFIENYIRELEEGEKVAKEKEEARIAEYRKRVEEEGLPMLTGTHRALTPEETKEMLAKQKERPNNLVILPSDEIAGPEDRQRYFRKIGSKILTPK